MSKPFKKHSTKESEVITSSKCLNIYGKCFWAISFYGPLYGQVNK